MKQVSEQKQFIYLENSGIKEINGVSKRSIRQIIQNEERDIKSGREVSHAAISTIAPAVNSPRTLAGSHAV